VVFDTFSRIARVENENDASEMQGAADQLNILLKAGIGDLLFQHERKAGGDIFDAGRGTNALAGVVDVMLRLQAVGGKQPNHRRLEAIGRLPLPAEPFVIGRRTADAGSRYEYLGDSAAIKRADTEQTLLDLWHDEPDKWLTEAQIIAQEGGTRSTVKRALDKLCEATLVERRGDGKRDSPFEYRARKTEI
jgi:hypothetical protein